MKRGRLYHLETLGTLDGPGVRTVFFMQGCNMGCLYCHNRDSRDIGGGREISIGELLSTVSSFRTYYGKRGGVTFSGGEPLLQSEFILEAVEALKNRGIHTALDTSGSVYSADTRRLFDTVNLVILDAKHSDSAVFRELCLFSDRSFRKNLKYLQKGKTPYWIRQVIVDGYTADCGQIDGLTEMVYRGNRPERIELLPYHNLGLEKWRAAGETCLLENTLPPGSDLMDQLRTRLRNSSTVSKK